MPQSADREDVSARAAETGDASQGWQARVKGFLAPRPARRPTAPPPRGGPVRGLVKNVFGMLVFVAGAEVLGPVLANLNLKFNLNLQTVRFAPPNTPFFGGLNGFLLLWFLAILALWLLLRRFDIIPKSLYGAGAAQTSRQSRQTQTTALRAGPPRTRAERRHAAAASAAAEAAATKGRGKARSTANAVVTRSTATRTSATRGTASRTAAVRGGVLTGDHDDAYARARAADRARRRRAARR